jgi:hypothetical protein
MAPLLDASRFGALLGYIRLHGRNYQNWFAENKRSSDRYDYLYSI